MTDAPEDPTGLWDVTGKRRLGDWACIRAPVDAARTGQKVVWFQLHQRISLPRQSIRQLDEVPQIQTTLRSREFIIVPGLSPNGQIIAHFINKQQEDLFLIMEFEIAQASCERAFR